MIINIVGGTGIMGKVHKPIFENAGHEVILTGRDTTPSPIEAAKTADLTIITVPVAVTNETIKKVAPHCNAIMDFTGVKQEPVKLMLENSGEDCEVAGLHPLYGDVESVKGKSVVLCETEKTGEKCKEIIKAFELAGAKIKKMDPEKHDKILSALLQNSRTRMLEAFGLLITESGLDIKEVYDLSPPPTKVILDLLARQVSEKNDLLYDEMRQNNPFQKEANEKLVEKLQDLENIKDSQKKIRKMFGDSLGEAQDRAKKII